MADKPICELPKNARETIQFRLAEFKGHRFIDLRIFTTDNDKDPSPTRKGLTVAPVLWSQFRKALAQVEAVMIQEGWLDMEDLEIKPE